MDEPVGKRKTLYARIVYRSMGLRMYTAVLSVRVRRKLKEEAEKLGIDIRAVVERALEEEIKKVKMEEFRNLVEEALKSMDLSEEEWIKTVKEVREED